ncbi:hypothetical protein AZA_50411 [Nitrospirillum viridazoti Y2]|nr:hypothetical protein AZA_50411 [Nitrospirillum amazonense Y2]
MIVIKARMEIWMIRISIVIGFLYFLKIATYIAIRMPYKNGPAKKQNTYLLKRTWSAPPSNTKRSG